MQQQTIVQKTYEFILFTIPALNKFPRQHKFLLADRIYRQLLELQELYIDAYYQSRSNKKALLLQANIQLEKLRYQFRLGFDLGLYSSTKYEAFAKHLQELGRMTGGWIKSLE